MDNPMLFINCDNPVCFTKDLLMALEKGEHL